MIIVGYSIKQINILIINILNLVRWHSKVIKFKWLIRLSKHHLAYLNVNNFF